MSAKTALALTGAVVGGMLGGPRGAQAGFALGSLAGGMIDGQPTQYGPRITDTRVSVSTYGVMVPVVYATMRVAGQVIWSTDIQEHKKEIDMGSKGGTEQVMYWYDISCAVGLCEGPMAGVLRIWADSKLVYDARPDATKAQKYDQPIRIYLGDEEQEADALIEGAIGAGTVPAHRGLCYVVLEDFPLADFGNRLPNFTVEVVQSKTPGHGISLITGFLPTPEDYPRTQLRLGSDSLVMDPRVGSPYCFAVSRGSFEDPGNPGYFYRVDLDAKAVDLQPRTTTGWGAHGPPDIDEHGWVYAQLGGFIFNQTIGRYSPDTGQVITTATIAGAQWLGTSGHIVVDRRNPEGLVWHITASDLHHGTVTAFSKIGLFHAFTIPRTTFGLVGGFYSGVYQVHDLTFDDAATAWAVVSGGGADETRLYTITVAGAVTLVRTFAASAYPQVTRILWVEADNSLILGRPGGAPSLIKYDIDSDTVTAEYTGVAWSQNLQSFHQGGIDGGSFWLAVSALVNDPDGPLALEYVPRFIEFSTATLEVLRDETMSELAANSYRLPMPPGYQRFLPQNAIYDRAGDRLVSQDLIQNAVGVFRLGVLGACVTLQSVVEDIGVKAGLTLATDLDATALANDLVCGYVVSRPAPLRQFLDPLTVGYFFGGVESNGKILCTKRGGASIRTLPEDDLATHGDGQERPRGPLLATRQQEIELPERIDVTYLNRATQYEQAEEHAKRLLRVIGTKEQVVLELPIVFTSGEAKRIAERHLGAAWVERDGYEFGLSYKHLALDPLDVITVTLDSGLSLRLRLTQIDYGGDGLLRCRAVRDDAAVFTAAWLAQDIEQFPGPGIPPIGPTVLQLMDIPILSDRDNSAGFYTAVAPAGSASDGWRGALLFASADAEEWTHIASLPTATPMGFAETVLASTERWTVFDETNTVRVRLAWGGLSSAGRAQVLNYANVGLLGDEIIQWTTATLVAAGTYTLSGLLRARRGTEWAVGAHALGERFVLLSTHTGLRLTLPPDGALFQERRYRALSLGLDFDSAGVQEFTNTGAGLRPYAPAFLTGSRIGDDLTISWLRRTRVSGELEDYHDVPLGERDERYEVDVLDSGGNVVRTLSSTTASVVYLASEQTIDFGSPQASVRARVYQISDRIGRGFPREAQL
jgi:hypothetical protein